MMKSEIINNIQHQIKPHQNQNQYIQLNRILKKRIQGHTNHNYKKHRKPKQQRTPNTIPKSEGWHKLLSFVILSNF